MTTSPGNRPTGRRSGDSRTRDAILDAARELFAERGYNGASVRAIAAEAGVDPGLIRHFFTDKESLFVTTMADRTVIPQRMAAVFSGTDQETLGARMADTYLRLWDDGQTRPILLGLARSAMTSRHAADLLAEVLSTSAGLPEFPSSDSWRAQGVALAMSHLFGVAVARHVLQIPAIVTLSHDDLVAHIAPAVQHYLTTLAPEAELAD